MSDAGTPGGAREPEAVHRRFVDAFNAGDLDALVALYEPGATLVPASGEPVSGTAAIRQALEGFLAKRGSMMLQPRKVLRAGDLALLVSRWVLRAIGPDGRPVELEGVTTDVVRRQAGGGWLVAIDNPFGTT